VCLPLDPRIAGSNPAEDDGFLRVIKIRSTTRHVKEPYEHERDALQAKSRGHVSHPCVSCFATRWL
jgi:hypothetical protein